MKHLFVAAAIMASLVGTQMIAEARGGAGGGSMGSAGNSRMHSANMGMRDTTGTQQQTRLRERTRLRDGSAAEGAGDKLQTRQQLRDPSLHTDEVTTPDAIDD